MEFGICNQSIVPVRIEPSDKVEMITQLLFGDLIFLNERNGSWVNITIVYDNYSGWVDCKQILELDENTFQTLQNLPSYTTLDMVHVLSSNNKEFIMPIVLGSTLPYMVNNSFYLKDDVFFYDGKLRDPKTTPDRSQIIDSALMYLNAPYLWGGKTPFGIDCSGLTQMVYKLSGIQLLRDTTEQVEMGETINFISESQAGDLAFFDNEEGEIIHVGIVINQNKIIHASGKVRIDTIDHNGIFNADSQKYTHKLRIIKSMI